MESFGRKKHWEAIYQTNNINEVSWYQPTPETSLQFLRENQIAKNAAIIDMGGGDSFFVDHLLELGYTDITVLDISAVALEKAKKRLGEKAKNVNWIVADAGDFNPPKKYDFWHDRAAFHFLTSENEIDRYIDTARNNINPNGVIVIGTFSESGPKKCSGIDIKQYSEISLSERLSKFFHKIRCITTDHLTPFNTIQNFVFCSFRNMKSG